MAPENIKGDTEYVLQLAPITHARMQESFCRTLAFHIFDPVPPFTISVITGQCNVVDVTMWRNTLFSPGFLECCREDSHVQGTEFVAYKPICDHHAGPLVVVHAPLVWLPLQLEHFPEKLQFPLAESSHDVL